MKLTYTAKETTVENGQAELGPNGPYCLIRSSPLLAPQETVVNVDVGETKTLVKGDRKHAMPYSASFTECSPFTESIKTDTVSWDPSDAFTIRYCGKFLFRHSNTIDIGSLVKPPTVAKFVPDPDTVGFLHDIAITKALADLRRSFANIPLLLAERRETIAYLGGKLGQLASVVKHRQTTDLKRYVATRRADRRRVAKDIASEHLGLVFGLLPLIQEIEGIQQKISAASTLRITGRGRMADETSISTYIDGVPVGVESVGQRLAACFFGTSESLTRLSCRVSLSMNVDVPAGQELRDWGFNPIATAYDLVPLSFLTDFVSNFGTFLRSYDPMLGATFFTGSVSDYWKRSEIVNVYSTKARATAWHNEVIKTSSGSGSATASYTEVHRAALTQLPDANFHFYNNFSLGKVASGVSLVVQRKVKIIRKLIKLKPFRYRGPRPKYLPPINYR